MSNVALSPTGARALLAATLLLTAAQAAVAADGPFSAVVDKSVQSYKPKLITNPTLLTLGLADAQVRAVLETMAKKGGMNVIIDESVQGTVTLNLKAVPLDDALNLVLKMKSLSAQRLGNTLLIATDEVFRKRGFSGTVTQLLRFDNAKLDDVDQILKEALGANGASAGTGGAPGGAAGIKIIKDPRTNSLLITATEDVVENALKLKNLLDVPTPQVEIEVRMIEVSEDGEKTLGVNYGFGGAKFGAGFNNGQPDTTAGGQGNQAGNPSTSDGGISLTYTALGNFTANFNARLNALIRESKATVIANPKVIAQDNKAATIALVNKHPIIKTTTTTTGTSTDVQTIDVGQNVTITPRIDTSGFVTLDVHPDISVESGTVNLNGNPVPIVNSRSVQTTMRVRDNEDIVIGGLKRDSAQTSLFKVPFLGDLPILGAAFRTTSVSNQRSSILIIVTPHIQNRLQQSSETMPTLWNNQNKGSNAPSAPAGAPPGAAPGF